MQKEKIIEFLIQAKKTTYAGKGPELMPSRPKSHDLAYEAESLRYIDTYIGSERFAGEEALWKENTPFWAMNYCGRVTGKGFEGDFLKEALSNVSVDMPYRGPNKYKKGSFTYECSVTGDFEWFTGYEKIYNDNEKVYECMFHGGAIK